MNITLIGMAGAGKSYIGKILADRLGLELLDIDRVMEKEEGKPLQDILDSLGDDAFITAETDAVRRMTGGKDGLLISPGGSIVYSDLAMQYLRDISKVVHLDVPFETIHSRIQDIPRGIVRLKGRSPRDVHDERLPLYRRYAHFSVDAGKDAEDVAAEIAQRVMV